MNTAAINEDPDFGAGDMAALVDSFPWELTALGPRRLWPASLRSIVNVMLASRHPMFLWWGPELIQIYNDAYRPSLGCDRHPCALGARGQEFWTEIWPTIGPQIDAVMQRGESTWNEDHLVPILRNGRLEEVYWTYGYSPVTDDDGRIGGVLVVVQEQTARVVATRRLRTLRDLAAYATGNDTQLGAWVDAFQVVCANRQDVPWSVFYEVEGEGTWIRAVAGRQREMSSLPDQIRAMMQNVLDTGQPMVLDDASELSQASDPTPRETCPRAFVLPLRRPHGGTPYGLFVAGLSASLPFDTDYRDFLSMAAEHVAAALTNARTREEEQRRIEALARLSAGFRELFEQAPAGVAVLSGPEHRFEVANPIFLAITHRRSLLGLTHQEAFPELAGTDLPRILDRVYETGEPFVAQEYCVSLDRTTDGVLLDSFFTFHLAPVREASGTVVALIAVAIDVTEIVVARRQLQESQARLELTLDAAGVGYWELDLMTKRATRSLRHDQIFGYRGGRSDWTFDTLLEHVLPEARERVAESFRRALAEGRDWAVDFPILGADGESRWVHKWGRAELSGPFAPRVLGIAMDMTERRELLAREQDARRRAEKASAGKDEFLATVSHELRTPLNTILGWSELLAEGGFTDNELQQGLATIHRNAHAQARMVEDLLDLSRLADGKRQIHLRPVDIASVLDVVIDSLRPAAAEKGVDLIRRDAGCARTLADPSLLEQVFLNLISNAVKFTPHGGRVDVSVSIRHNEIVIRVADNGEGIDPEFQPYMFERFSQGDRRPTRRHGGLGIGLSIVKQLVEAHRGTVRGASAGRNQGAVFTVSLPALTDHGGAVSVQRPQADRAKELGLEGLSSLEGVRILLVEDDPDALKLIKRILVDRRADVVTAVSVAEALAAFNCQRFDLVLSDIGMPHEDGYELIRRIRMLPAGSGGTVPALALTAYARPRDREAALAAGFHRHLPKPIDTLGLLQACASLIMETRGR